MGQGDPDGQHQGELRGAPDPHASWPGIAVRRTASLRSPMSRPSTSCLLIRRKEDVDARIRGHDEREFWCPAWPSATHHHSSYIDLPSLFDSNSPMQITSQ